MKHVINFGHEMLKNLVGLGAGKFRLSHEPPEYVNATNNCYCTLQTQKMPYYCIRHYMALILTIPVI